MPLTLTVRTVDRAAAAPPPLRLDRRGAVIGRAPGLDWTLPDERATVSARHCEIAFRDGAYLIADSSTNGTFVDGERLVAPRQLRGGEVIGIGPYEIVANLTAAGVAAQPPAAAAPGGDGAVAQLLRAAGVPRAEVGGSDADILAAAGALLGTMTGGIGTLLAQRVRARTQLGIAPPPGDAANPLHQPGPPAQLLARLLRAPQAAERAIAEAFVELDAHQLATLQAMQGAMAATLERFAPAAVRARAGAEADDAVFWQDYERAFCGTGPARADGFIEIFARELQTAYEALTTRR